MFNASEKTACMHLRIQALQRSIELGVDGINVWGCNFVTSEVRDEALLNLFFQPQANGKSSTR